jgi:hypothetical protein
MKEAYAVKRTVPPSAEIQASIDRLLSKGMVDDPQKLLSELARLSAQLIIQRAVEDEFDTWLAGPNRCSSNSNTRARSGTLLVVAGVGQSQELHRTAHQPKQAVRFTVYEGANDHGESSRLQRPSRSQTTQDGARRHDRELICGPGQGIQLRGSGGPSRSGWSAPSLTTSSSRSKKLKLEAPGHARGIASGAGS